MTFPVPDFVPRGDHKWFKSAVMDRMTWPICSTEREAFSATVQEFYGHGDVDILALTVWFCLPEDVDYQMFFNAMGIS